MILFDVGGVLIRYDQRAFFHGLCGALRGQPTVDLPWLFDWIVSLRCTKDWERSSAPCVERFRMTTEDLWDVVFQCYADASVRNDEALGLLRELHAKGSLCAILSNTNSVHWTWLVRNLPELAVCAPIVLSYEVGCAKPGPQIFAAAVSACGMRAHEVVLVDDDAKNVESAKKSGIHAVQYLGASVHPLVRELDDSLFAGKARSAAKATLERSKVVQRREQGANKACAIKSTRSHD